MHIHVVKRGDTLSSIAAMHDALPAFVAADNGLALSTPLVIGQALVVRTPKTLHTVRAGETLSSIARDYDLSVRTLLRRNFSSTDASFCARATCLPSTTQTKRRSVRSA